jgi:hypothetical protein
MALALAPESAAADVLPPPPVPESVGPYAVVRQIAVGGMGVVYEARQHGPLERAVAVKVVRLGMDTREVVRRFAAERQINELFGRGGRMSGAWARPRGRVGARRIIYTAQDARANEAWIPTRMSKTAADLRETFKVPVTVVKKLRSTK